MKSRTVKRLKYENPRANYRVEVCAYGGSEAYFKTLEDARAAAMEMGEGTDARRLISRIVQKEIAERIEFVE